MKRILVAVVAASCFNAFAQSPAQFAKNAEEFSSKASTPIFVVRESRSGPGWAKLQARVAAAKWDVKKTDSLLAPVIAVVTFDLQHGVSIGHATKDDAESASPAEWAFLDRVELEYVPTKTGWALSKGRSYHHGLKQWFPAKSSPGTFTPTGWAIEGFSVGK